jgi:hypothetical protein
MCLVVGGFDVCGADVGVDLCSDEALVAEEFLDASNICTAVEQMRSKTVAERMWAGSSI